MPGTSTRLRFGILAASLLVWYLIRPVSMSAQVDQKANIEGTWQGTLHVPKADLRIVLKVSKTDTGVLKGVNYSIDQGGQPISASSITFEGGVLKFGIEVLNGTYEGKMSADGNSIAGEWRSGPNPLPLVFGRATPETAWIIPERPERLPPMPADADPSFEVATIKPSKPDQRGGEFVMHGNRFITVNTTLTFLIKSAYGLQEQQIVGGPAWMNTDKFDIEAEPDIHGSPNNDQLNTMVKKLLAERFQLKFHRVTKDLPSYVLTVAKNGLKMQKSDSAPGSLPGLFFRGFGVLTVQNATMQDFCELMQSMVLDRPVVDHTGLADKWNFLLKWTPDDSQFREMGINAPPPADAADAAPPLFTAIQEQIGLKLEAAKAQVGVLMIDHVEKPSGN